MKNVIIAVILTQYLDWWAKFSSFFFLFDLHAFHKLLIIFPVVLFGCRTGLSGVKEEHKGEGVLEGGAEGDMWV
jgi:hypothetical protein